MSSVPANDAERAASPPTGRPRLRASAHSRSQPLAGQRVAPTVRSAAPVVPVDPDAPPGVIAVTARVLPLSLMFLLSRPRITVDGRRVASAWGRNVVAVPAGGHVIAVATPFVLWGERGHATATVAVAGGQSVELEYRCPVHALAPGSLGEAPQRYNGVGPLVAIGLGVAAIMVCNGLAFWLIGT